MSDIGKTVGRYILKKAIHTGGMATVYVASDLEKGMQVALKLLHKELALDAELVMRFVNEAHILDSLSHPALPRFYDGQFLPEGIFIALELLGLSLAERFSCAAKKPLLTELLCVGRQISAGLGALHSQGVVHRDLKPDNILLSIDGVGHAKLVDFGLAKVSSPLAVHQRSESSQLTQFPIMPVSTSGDALLGTWEYMAPEQWRDPKRVDGKADIYSLGVVLYFGLTGSFPFKANGPKGWMSQHLYQEPVPLGPECMANEQVRRFIMRMISKDPAERPTALDAVTALQD